MPADFDRPIARAFHDWDVEFWERVVSGIRNLRALMTALSLTRFEARACYISVMAKPRPRTTVAVILFATLGTCGAQADDTIRPGKWAFSAVVSDATAPLGAEWRSNRLALRQTECIGSDDPLPPMARGPSTPRYGKQACNIVAKARRRP